MIAHIPFVTFATGFAIKVLALIATEYLLNGEKNQHSMVIFPYAARLWRFRCPIPLTCTPIRS